MPTHKDTEIENKNITKLQKIQILDKREII